ncbi:hypothetical protein Tco_0486971 [Tanacetum coccineum]
MPFDAMHFGCALLAVAFRGFILAFRCYALWLISFDRWSVKRYNFAFRCHARWLISFDSQSSKRYIMPFGAMYAGSSLLARQHKAKRYIMPFGSMHTGSSLLADKRYIMPFDAMHAGSSLLTGGQQREVYYAFRCHARWLISFGSSAQRYIMPFGAMHAGSSLLTDGQQRGTLCLLVLCTLAHPGCINIVWGIPDGLASYRGKMYRVHDALISIDLSSHIERDDGANNRSRAKGHADKTTEKSEGPDDLKCCKDLSGNQEAYSGLGQHVKRP